MGIVVGLPSASVIELQDKSLSKFERVHVPLAVFIFEGGCGIHK